MEKEKVDQQLRTIAHNVRASVDALENAFNGALSSPRKEQYRIIFDLGKTRLMKDVSSLIEQLRKALEAKSDE